MRNARRRLRSLGLALMATMGLVAFMATSAQAVTWDINGAEINSNETIGGNPIGEALLLVPALNLIIHCKKVDVEAGSQILWLPNDADVKLLFLECVTLVKGVKSAGCTPEILLVGALVLPILHGGIVWLLAEPLKEKKSFNVIHYNEETCALPPLPEVTGSVVFECYTGALVRLSCSHSRVTQLIRAVPSPVKEELFPTDELRYGMNVALLDVEAEVFLNGARAGLPWAALV